MSIDNRSKKPGIHPPPSGKSKTLQEPGQSASVRDIVARHVPGQAIGDPRATRMPKFLDMPSETLHELLIKAEDAKLAFQGLPSRLKGKFNNNPVTMLRWTEQPENRKEALKLGLLVPTDKEAQELALEAAKARRGEQIDLVREAMRPDPEAQPDYKAKNPPKGGASA